MNEFQRKVEEFFTELVVSGKKISSFLESGEKDYRNFLIPKKGRRLGYLQDVRKACGHRGLVNLCEKLVITSTNEAGDLVALAEEDKNGLDYPSEWIVEWLYHGKTTIEPPILAAYHKFYEVVKGIDVGDITLQYFGEKTSTITQENRDITYEISLFYRAHVPYDIFQKIEKKKRWKVIALPENTPY